MTKTRSVENLFDEVAYSEENVTRSFNDIKSNSSFDVQSWLPFISPKYHISPNMSDYLVVPVIICPTDLPNRKNVAFPFKSLVDFNIRRAMPCYKTWKGMPVQIDHINTDVTKAAGVVLDTIIKPIHGVEGNLHKVVALLALDKTKNYDLIQAIKSKRRKYYSMGAVIDTYECSICGMRSKLGKIDTDCGHVSRSSVNLVQTPQGLKAAHYLAHGINGFEVSTVSFPAWASADSTDVKDMGI